MGYHRVHAAVNIALTFTDRVGSWDIVTALIDLAPLGLLIAIRTIPTKSASPSA